MAFAKKGFVSLGLMGSAVTTPGTMRRKHTYITNDLPAEVEAADYFLSIYGQLSVGDQIDASLDVDGSPVLRHYIVRTSGSGGVTIGVADNGDAGAPARAVVPTADGLTTGLIHASDSFVTIASGGANNIATLPLASAATRGKEVWLWVEPSTNCELRTPADSDQTINNVNSDGTNEALLTHTQLYRCIQHLDTGWLLMAWTALGAVATAIVPD